MSASFQEKSVWVQLVSLVIGMGVYGVVAGGLLARGVTAMPAYAALFLTATVWMVVLLIAGHVAAALSGRVEDEDERDRLIGWRAEALSSWVVATGVLGGVTAMAVGVEGAWVANGLLLSLVAATAMKLVLQIVFYRRGA